MIRLIAGMLLCALHLIPLYADQRFAPWDASVAAGDKGSHPDFSRFLKNGADASAPIIQKRHMHGGVYNGPQAGAFFLIRFFQIVISPQDGPSCRFAPVCSAYGKWAVERFGALIGPLLAGDRLLRCNPYSPPGRDPLPNFIIDHDHTHAR